VPCHTEHLTIQEMMTIMLTHFQKCKARTRTKSTSFNATDTPSTEPRPVLFVLRSPQSSMRKQGSQTNLQSQLVTTALHESKGRGHAKAFAPKVTARTVSGISTAASPAQCVGDTTLHRATPQPQGGGCGLERLQEECIRLVCAPSGNELHPHTRYRLYSWPGGHPRQGFIAFVSILKS
jgi:hypothetical protein